MSEASPRSVRELLRDPVLQLIFGVTLMVVMGVTSIAPAFTEIMAAMAVSDQSIGLLLTAFTLPGVILTPVMGVLADRHGRRLILAPSLAMFGIFGTACAFAQDFDALVLLRFFQGMGSASLGALNITLIGDHFPGKERISALGLNAAVLSLGVALNPLVGGALAQIHWRLPFFLPLAAFPLVWLAWKRLPGRPAASATTLADYFRTAWLGMKQPKVLGLFAATTTTFVLIYGPFLTYLPVHLGKNLHAQPIVIGLLIASSAIFTALFTTQLGRFSQWLGATTLLKIAFLLYAMAHVGMYLAPSLWWYFIPVTLLGMAQGLNIPVVQHLMTEYAPPQQRAAFMAMNGMMLRLGQTIGPLLFALAFHLDGLTAVFLLGAVLAMAMCFLAMRIYR